MDFGEWIAAGLLFGTLGAALLWFVFGGDGKK
jgi:hypothetical protein